MNTSSTAHGSDRPEPAFFRGIRSAGVTRSDDRIVAGVLAGLAQHWGLNRAVLRVAVFVAGFVLFPITVTAYAVAWLILPGPDGRIVLEHEDFAHTHGGAE